MLTTQQAADRLEITRRRLRTLITSGRLSATKIGRDWMIEPAALAAVRVRRPGRPKGK